MITPTEQFIAFLRDHGITVLDRRPGSPDPLPFRGDVERGEFGGFTEYDFAKECEGLCGHHDACPQKVGGRAEQHARHHLKRWNSAGGIAYTATIAPDGRFTLAWSLNRRLYSQGWKDVADRPETLGDENKRFKGILVEGNMNGPHNPGGLDEPTPAQMHTLEVVRIAFWILFEKKAVTGHFEHGKPACPGSTLSEWVRAHNIGAASPKVDEAPIDLDSDLGVQTALQLAGFYHGKLDGDFGPKSKAALKVFQRTHGLTEDGILGPITRAALLKAFTY